MGLQDIVRDELQKKMPKEIELEDGSKEEVFSKEEFDEIKGKLDENSNLSESFNKLKEVVGAGEGDDIVEKIKELQENSDPDWREMRKNYNELKKKVKDTDTNTVEENKIDTTDIDRIVQERLDSFKEEQGKNILEKEINKKLEGLSEEDVNTVKPVIEKLQQLGGELDENIEFAMMKVFPEKMIDRTKMAINSRPGGFAKTSDEKKDFTKTEEGKALLGKMFPEINLEKK